MSKGLQLLEVLTIAGALSNHLIIRNEFTELELFAKTNSFMVVSKKETNQQSSFNYVRSYIVLSHRKIFNSVSYMCIYYIQIYVSRFGYVCTYMPVHMYSS